MKVLLLSESKNNLSQATGLARADARKLLWWPRCACSARQRDQTAFKPVAFVGLDEGCSLAPVESTRTTASMNGSGYVSIGWEGNEYNVSCWRRVTVCCISWYFALQIAIDLWNQSIPSIFAGHEISASKWIKRNTEKDHHMLRLLGLIRIQGFQAVWKCLVRKQNVSRQRRERSSLPCGEMRQVLISQHKLTRHEG